MKARNDIAISAEGLSKSYLVGHQARAGRDGDLREALVRGARSLVRRTGDLLHGRPLVSGDEVEEFWALRDVSFQVGRGDRVGIIGRNGAGKSTLLKILSRITQPTAGRVRIAGRVASLLEVGTGFHPDLTGRENVFLNGAILGMRRAEIQRRFDEIVAFAEVDKFLDTPVKRYSSGMYVRLAFAVAAHLDPEILIVDEVLAVGDAQFQRKCLGKMQDVAGDGRTVLFVSHNVAAVKNLCNRAILLDAGRVVQTGHAEAVVELYQDDRRTRGVRDGRWELAGAPGAGHIRVKSAYVRFPGRTLSVRMPFDIVCEFWNARAGFPVNLSLHVTDASGLLVFNISTPVRPLRRGLHRATFHIPADLMNDGTYSVDNYFVTEAAPYFVHRNAHSFEILDERESTEWHGKWAGAIRPTFIPSDLECIEEPGEPGISPEDLHGP